MGNRFIKPKFILNKAIILIKEIIPAFAAEPDKMAICIGPPIFSEETEPVTIFPIESKIKTVKMQLGSSDESGREKPETILGSEELIEVDNFFINTIEIQNTVIERKEYFSESEFGIDILFFVDWGVGYNMNSIIDFNNSLFGYGVGLKIFLLGGTIKLDYGFNLHGDSKSYLF